MTIMSCLVRHYLTLLADVCVICVFDHFSMFCASLSDVTKVYVVIASIEQNLRRADTGTYCSVDFEQNPDKYVSTFATDVSLLRKPSQIHKFTYTTYFF